MEFRSLDVVPYRYFSRVCFGSGRGKFKNAFPRKHAYTYRRKFRAAEYFPLNLVPTKTRDKCRSSITAKQISGMFLKYYEVVLRKYSEILRKSWGSSALVIQSQFLALSRATVHPHTYERVQLYMSTYLSFDNDRVRVPILVELPPSCCFSCSSWKHGSLSASTIPPTLVIKLMEIRLDAFMRFHPICVQTSLKHWNAIHSRFSGDKRKPRNSTTSDACGTIITIKWNSHVDTYSRRT